MSKTIDEILDTVSMWSAEHERGNIFSNQLWVEQKEAKQAIAEAIEYVIGSDDPYSNMGINEKEFRIGQRLEQLKRLKEVLADNQLSNKENET